MRIRSLTFTEGVTVRIGSAPHAGFKESRHVHLLMIHAKWSSCVSTINFNGDPANFTHILLTYWWTNDRQPCSRGNAERQETCHFGSQLVAVKQLKAESSDVASYDCVVAFPIWVSQFRIENAKIKKAQKTKPTSVRIRNYKNTRPWSFQNNARQRRQLGKYLCVFWSRRARPPPPPKARSLEDMWQATGSWVEVVVGQR